MPDKSKLVTHPKHKMRRLIFASINKAKCFYWKKFNVMFICIGKKNTDVYDRIRILMVRIINED